MRTQAEFEAMFNCKAPAGQLPGSACCSCYMAFLALSKLLNEACIAAVGFSEGSHMTE